MLQEESVTLQGVEETTSFNRRPLRRFFVWLYMVVFYIGSTKPYYIDLVVNISHELNKNIILLLMKRISTVTVAENLDIDILYEKGKLAYTFQHNGQNYGNAVRLPSKSVADIASACFLLFTNAVDTKKALK